jgi:hypothetical protein
LLLSFWPAKKPVLSLLIFIPELGPTFAGTGTVAACRRVGVWACRRVGALRWRGRLRANVFVPEGLNDRSLAVYCQGPAHKTDPPRRVRYDLGSVVRPYNP